MGFLDIIFIIDAGFEGAAAIINLKSENAFFFHQNNKFPTDARV
jgi:hypothetical protein